MIAQAHAEGEGGKFENKRRFRVIHLGKVRERCLVVEDVSQVDLRPGQYVNLMFAVMDTLQETGEVTEISESIVNIPLLCTIIYNMFQANNCILILKVPNNL